MANSSNVVVDEKWTVHPDLVKERAKATFRIEELTHIVDGGPARTKRRREIEKTLFADPVFHSKDRIHLSKSELYQKSVEKSVKLFTLKNKLNWSEDDFHLAERAVNHDIALSLHHSMFIPAIERLATDEQKAKWLPLALNFDIIGTYAQTELGHGTNLLGLETTATFDPQTDEFILNTPHITSMKWWPGSLGKSSTHAIVLAQLVIRGKNYGLHPFMVQLRSLDTHLPLPGITVGDIGPKIALNHIDNGFLVLKDVRIPRDQMFMKNAQVMPEGEFRTLGSSKANYATMMLVRVMITLWSFQSISDAATSAVRYSCVRRQSSLKPGDKEWQVLDYQTQQAKVLGPLADAYALLFTTQTLDRQYNQAYPSLMAGKRAVMAEMHSQSSVLKAHTSEVALAGIDACRRACGGHGFMAVAGVGELQVSSWSMTIVEGENSVLYQQTARFLLKQVAAAVSGGQVAESCQYLTLPQPFSCLARTEAEFRNPDLLLQIFSQRTYGVVTAVARGMQRDMEAGLEQHLAWNNNMVPLTRAAKVHAEWTVLHSFVSALRDLQGRASHAVVDVLTTLCLLHATQTLTASAGDFLQTKAISREQLDMLQGLELKLLAEVRPNAVALVDAFDIHDICLHSALGCYDGRAYERLYESALQNPMNKSSVHPAYYLHLRQLLKSTTPKAQL